MATQNKQITQERSEAEQQQQEFKTPLDEAQQMVADAIKAGPRKKEGPPACTEPTRQRIVDFFAKLDRKSKLAVLLYDELCHLEMATNFQARIPDEQRIIEHIENVLSRELDEIGTDTEETWLLGVWQACQMVAHNT